MSRTLISVAFAAAAFVAVPAVAADAAPAPRDAEASGNEVREPAKICVRERMPGTYHVRQICKTEQQWLESEGEVPSRD